ncbi:hypothetical protein OsJ_14056 [Oryza sativa Japonica Group]|uniref:Uncharacterized protein n=1 Tax=Oryza sativa subsp. japonica TaxID=39947 RepID=A3ARQ5_ORYSJ|nr:hypothetical protein OsJ_14056 [Oryza sativa Japonica Group]
MGVGPACQRLGQESSSTFVFFFLPTKREQHGNTARTARPAEGDPMAARGGAEQLWRSPAGDHGAWRRGGKRRGMATIAELGLQVARAKGRVSD